MLSNRPYLMRAFYDWIVDSACTPILVLDATNPRCKVPANLAEGGEIVFNISPVAVRDLKITNDVVEFNASFTGVIHIISAPVKAVLAVYAEENGEGLFFDADEMEDEATGEVVQLKTVGGTMSMPTSSDEQDGDMTRQQMIPPSESTSPKGKPFLKLVE
jgi:stringent starvation protein B